MRKLYKINPSLFTFSPVNILKWHFSKAKVLFWYDSPAIANESKQTGTVGCQFVMFVGLRDVGMSPIGLLLVISKQFEIFYSDSSCAGASVGYV